LAFLLLKIAAVFLKKTALGGARGGGRAPPKQLVLKHCPQEAGHDAPLILLVVCGIAAELLS